MNNPFPQFLRDILQFEQLDPPEMVDERQILNFAASVVGMCADEVQYTLDKQKIAREQSALQELKAQCCESALYELLAKYNEKRQTLRDIAHELRYKPPQWVASSEQLNVTGTELVPTTWSQL